MEVKVPLKEYARSIGFDRIGITSADPPEDFKRYQQWVEKGFAGNMWYLAEKSRSEKRGDLQKILPGAKSVIVGAISYAPQKTTYPSNAKIARYAWGDDYHRVLQTKLEMLASWLTQHSSEPFQYLTYVDTGPLLERSLAQRAGIGWIGKNTCVMHESIGSYLFLGEILTTLELPIDSPATNRCGTCTRCLEACPTNAFQNPYELDATQCISYQTIENRKEEIPDAIRSELQGWVAGCDICQEVCPWNREPLPTRIAEFSPKPHSHLSLEQLSELTPSVFEEFFQNTSLSRTGWKKIAANSKMALHYLRKGEPGV
jgi:epoxyqueuosine reductase